MARKAINTRVPAREASRTAEQLPHERDEAVGMTDGIPSDAMQQAHRDLRRGLQDTDRGPVTDRTYQKLKR